MRFDIRVTSTVESVYPSLGFLQREPLPGAADFHIIAVPGRHLGSGRHTAAGYVDTYQSRTGGTGIRLGGRLRDHDLVGGRAAWVPFASVNDERDHAAAHETGHGVFGLVHPVENEYPLPGYESNLMALGFVPDRPDVAELSSAQIQALVDAAERALGQAPPLAFHESRGEWGPRVDGVAARRVASWRNLE